MSEHDLAQLLHDVTPQPPVGLDFDRIAARAHRRRRVLVSLIVSSSIILISATAVMPVVLGGRNADRLAPGISIGSGHDVPPAVLDAAQQLRADVEAADPISIVWVMMRWNEWQQLSGQESSMSHASDYVYVVQIGSDQEMNCLACKGESSRVTGRYATLVVPENGEGEADLMIGDDDFGVRSRPDVRTLSTG